MNGDYPTCCLKMTDSYTNMCKHTQTHTCYLSTGHPELLQKPHCPYFQDGVEEKPQ